MLEVMFEVGIVLGILHLQARRNRHLYVIFCLYSWVRCLLSLPIGQHDRLCLIILP